MIRFQSTPLQEGRQADFFRYSLGYRVSIHAPAGGATLEIFTDPVEQFVSIHAPAGGATGQGCGFCTKFKVSIHAPAGGATHLHMTILKQDTFQSTPLQEGRHLVRIQIA